MAGLTAAVGGPVGIVNIVMVERCVMMPGLLGHTLGRQLSTLSAGKRQALLGSQPLTPVSCSVLIERGFLRVW